MCFIKRFKEKLEEINNEECNNCGFKDSCKPSITQSLYDDVYRLWEETMKRTEDKNEPLIALQRFQNKYEVF